VAGRRRPLIECLGGGSGPPLRQSPAVSDARLTQGETEPHRARRVAESFGSDPERYDRTRPGYPDALVARIVAALPGLEVLDVGCGTGIAARQFQAAGCEVLGVEVDERMAEFARQAGLEVEVSRFEDWNPAGRVFDAVVSGTTWHWIDPVGGADKVAEVLRPMGRVAVFWNVHEPPPELAERFTETYRRVLPDTPFAVGAASGVRGYSRILLNTADGIRQTGAFSEPEQWRHDWERSYTRDEWLELVPTAGGHSRFPAATLDQLLDGLGAAIDAVGGSFTMPYATVAVTATRNATA
jgi:SAM-dependent methyltransferase